MKFFEKAFFWPSCPECGGELAAFEDALVSGHKFRCLGKFCRCNHGWWSYESFEEFRERKIREEVEKEMRELLS